MHWFFLMQVPHWSPAQPSQHLDRSYLNIMKLSPCHPAMSPWCLPSPWVFFFGLVAYYCHHRIVQCRSDRHSSWSFAITSTSFLSPDHCPTVSIWRSLQFSNSSVSNTTWACFSSSGLFFQQTSALEVDRLCRYSEPHFLYCAQSLLLFRYCIYLSPPLYQLTVSICLAYLSGDILSVQALQRRAIKRKEKLPMDFCNQNKCHKCACANLSRPESINCTKIEFVLIALPKLNPEYLIIRTE